jgi:hypothetical protein
MAVQKIKSSSQKYMVILQSAGAALSLAMTPQREGLLPLSYASAYPQPSGSVGSIPGNYSFTLDYTPLYYR